ncbi:MAG TPA: DivIVA domain-containing protein [Iamia sp.]|nr:DivIVA domain-containing protein [Iamia sp.]
MDISSSLSGTKEFRIVKRGYDPDEVNAFLDQIALGVGELKRKLAEAEDAADEARQVAATPAPAPAPAAPSLDAAAEAQAAEIQRALILAQRAADEEVRKATEEGEALVASARQRAEALRVEVEAEVARRRDEGRADLLAEIDELERVRDSLSNDVVVLERHVEEQREVVQAAIGELQTLLDHPEAFRVSDETGVSTARVDIDREPTPVPAAPAAEPAPDDELPGKADLTAALAWAAAEEGSAEEAPSTPRSDGAPPPAPTADDRPSRPAPAPASAPEPVAEEPAAAPPASPGEPFAGPRGGDDDDRDLGPPTEAVATVGADTDPDEDAFLAELRKAMLDDEPLGPRRGDEPGAPVGVDDDAGRGRPRFGRRR